MAFSLNDLNYEKDSKERMPWEHYTQEFATADPKEIASRLSIPYDEEAKKLTLTFLGTQYQITWPDFEVTHTPDDKGFYPLENMIYARILTIRFLLNGVKSESSGKFKTYREMPWGEVYLRQFDGRCIKRLAFSYGNRPGDFRAIMEHISAIPVKHGDIAYEVEIFPEYKIQMILWEGDEEFPPSSQILFSDNFPVSFQAEDMAVMGDVIDVARNMAYGCNGRISCTCYKNLPVKDIGDVKNKFFIRMQVTNEPGVLAAVAEVFGNHKVSITRVVQEHTQPHQAELVIVTESVKEKYMKRALEELLALPSILEVSSIIREY